MRKKSRVITLVIALFAVTVINVTTVLNASHSYDLAMTSIEAISGEGNTGGGAESGGGIGGENDDDIWGEVELPEVTIKCGTGGSGKYYYPMADSDKCYYACLSNGDPDSSCSSFLMSIVNFCTAIS